MHLHCMREGKQAEKYGVDFSKILRIASCIIWKREKKTLMCSDYIKSSEV